MHNCKRNVPSATGFIACGKPAPNRLIIGRIICYFCDEHIKDAQNFVSKVNDDVINAIQEKINAPNT